ncbi:MAG: N-formylglutamate amidohydrolase [Chloroflexi bacterium]|nr:N-formylglutamate amidohydrolase [Chloroflexota bacterium]
MITMQKLPIALISSHGSLTIPPELDGRIALTPEQIFNEADAYLNDIFDFRDRVLYLETFPYSRAIIDVNRPADSQLHHRIGDGVVKRQTSYGRPVYHPRMEPEANLEQYLIHHYWQPWHDRLSEIEHDPRVKLVIDCHSMAAVGPDAFDDPMQLRPRVQTGNLGDYTGKLYPPRQRISAPADITVLLADELGRQLADIPALTETGKTTAVNQPFSGGWNLWAHGHTRQPWLMIELNRALYIGRQHGSSPIVPSDPTRIALLRERIWTALTAVSEYTLTNLSMVN